MSRPRKLPEWATAVGADIVEPSSGRKGTGWERGKQPPAPYFNWHQNLTHKWIEWIKDRIDSLQLENWTRDNTGSGVNMNGIAFDGDTTTIAVGDSGVIRRTTNFWETVAIDSSGIATSLEGIAHNNGTWVAVGAAGTILYNTGGSSWNAAASGTSEILHSVIWSDLIDQFVCVGEEHTILTSPDGVTWTAQNADNPGTGDNYFDVASGDGQIVICGRDASAGAVEIQSSPDGVNWTERTSATLESTARTIVWDGSQFLLGLIGGALETSPDGLTWTAQTIDTTSQIRQLVVGDGVVAALSSSDELFSSEDGVSWATRVYPVSASLINDGIYGGGRFMLVGQSDELVLSLKV